MPAERPFAGGELPPRFRSEVSPLLRFLDRERLPYDLTTDLSLARREGPAIGNAPGVAIAGTALWLPRRVRDRLLEEVKEGGLAVASFGRESLRRTVALDGERAAQPQPAAARRPLRRAHQHLRVRPAGAPARGVRPPGPVRAGRRSCSASSRVFERSDRLPPDAELLTSAGREEGRAGVRRLPPRQGHGGPARHAAVGAAAGGVGAGRRGAPRHPQDLARSFQARLTGSSGRPLPSCAPVLRYLLIAAAARSLLGAGGAVATRCSPTRTRPRSAARPRRSSCHRTSPEPPEPPKRKLIAEPWPTFGYDIQRTKVSPYDYGPPYRRTWRVDARDTLEFPPSRRLRQRLPGAAEGPLLRPERQDRQADLQDQELQALRRVVADTRDGTIYQAYMDFMACGQGDLEPDRLRDRDGREDRPAEVALQGQAVRVVAAAAQRDPLRGLLGRQRARDPGEDRQARVDPPDRQPGEHVRRLLEGADLHRQPGRHPLRAQREGPAGSPGARARPRSSSTPPRRWPTGGCSSAAPTARCTPTAHAPASCCGPSRWARTSTRRRRSTTGRSTPAPTTASSTRSTPPPATCAGSARWRARCMPRRW